jgi:radical SAM protein with 4Fe4S-binding SPASM domain
MIPYPSFVQLYPTLRCNQRCTFCFNQNIIPETHLTDMKSSDARALCDILQGIGTSEIDILGGEPLLVPWMTDFVAYAIGAGLSINISTNGSLPNVVNELAHIETRDLHMGFSILGFEKTHNRLTQSNNFSKAIHGIKTVQASGKHPVVKSTLTRENFHEIHDLVLYLSELGIKKYYLLHEDLLGRNEQMPFFSFPQFWQFYTNLKTIMEGIIEIDFVAASGFCTSRNSLRGRCNAGLTKIAVMPDGSSFPCNLLTGFKNFYLGNILNDDIEEIWGNRILEFFRDANHKNICKNHQCIHYLTCRGGCPAHSYSFYGNSDRVDPRCNAP